MDAATCPRPKPPALSLPPVPLSCPQLRSGYPTLTGPWAGPSLLSALSAPPGGCLPRSPGVSWEHGWYHGHMSALGPTHPCTCQPAPAPDQPVLSVSIAQVTERQWICSTIYFHCFPLFFCSHGWCAFYDFREVFLCSRKCKFLTWCTRPGSSASSLSPSLHTALQGHPGSPQTLPLPESSSLPWCPTTRSSKSRTL